MTPRSPQHGQSLVEFALVLPTFLLVGLLFIQLCLLGVTWAHLNNVASVVARQVAAANGETSTVDDALLHVAGSNGLHGEHLWAEIDTDAGMGRVHRADRAQASDAPPPADYNGTITVHLTYYTPLVFGFFGATVALGASSALASSAAYGRLAP